MQQRDLCTPARAPRRRRFRLLLALGLVELAALPVHSVLIGGGGALAIADQPLYRGRPLEEVLHSLQQRGLKVIYSTAVIDRRMRVTLEPTATDPRGVLDEILAPLGLRAEDGPSGSVLIVPAAASFVLAGRIISSAHGTPVTGAAVTIRDTGAAAISGPDGTFLIRGVPEGSHEVLVEAAGYFARSAVVEVRPPRTRDLLVGLEPRRTYVEEVVVTPGRVTLLQQEQPSTLSLSDVDVLLSPSLGGDVSRFVESLPGVAAADNSSAFHLRGGLAQDVSFVLDGLELYEPYHLLQFQSPFSHLDTDIADRVEVLGGPFTADYGDRHGGIVQVSTRTADDAARSQISLGNINSRVSHAGRLSGRDASWLASLRAWYPEAFRSSIEIGEPGLEPHFADAYLKTTFLVSPSAVVSAHGLVAHEQFDFKLAGEEQTADTSTSSGHFWLRDLRSWRQAVSSETVLSGGWIDRFRAGISDPEDELLRVEDDRQSGFFGLRHDTTWRIRDAHRLKAGLDVRRLETKYRYRSSPVADPASIVTLRPKPAGTSYGVYLADRVAVTTDLAAEIGLRWDRQTWSDESHVSPRLNALWRLGERSEVRIGLGEYFQSQRIHELRVEDGEREFRPAERSRQIGLTFTHRFAGDLRFRLDAYYRTLDRQHPRYENVFSPIEIYPETEPDRVLVAADRARLKGAELLLHAAPGRKLYWRVSYALSSAEDVIHGDGVPRSWDQTHAGTFLVGYRLQNRWFFSLAGSAHTGWPTTPFRSDLVVDPADRPALDEVLGSRNSDRFPTYLRFDVKASRSFAFRAGTLRLEMEILNVTDRRNACCVDDVEIEVMPNGSVEVDSELGYWLGSTPTARLTWEF